MINYFTGFRVNSGEYKLMGLAPYGEPKYVALIYEKLIDLSVVQAALSKAGGRLTGDKRWD